MRRDFITIVDGAAEWPLAMRARLLGGVARIGVLMADGANETVARS